VIRRRVIIPLLACCVLAAAPFAAAQDRLTAPEARNPQANPTTPGLLNRIRGLFDIDLPHLDPPGTFRLTFNPRLGDLLHRDYIRLPTGVRWAVNDHLGFNVEAEAYATHGLGGGTGNYGFGMIRVGGKYLLPRCPSEFYQTSVGLETAVPVGSPPYDLTDGHNHFSPSIVVERHDPKSPRWTQFAGFSFDVVTPSGVNGDFGLNTPKDDSLSLTGGAIYNLGQLKWTVQGTYTTTALITDGSEHFLTIRPSVLWFVPRRFTFNSKTQWIIGVGVRSTWGPDGYEFSTGTRVRAEITFGQALQKIRGTFEKRR
jgi:hypothetical protein